MNPVIGTETLLKFQGCELLLLSLSTMNPVIGTETIYCWSLRLVQISQYYESRHRD